MKESTTLHVYSVTPCQRTYGPAIHVQSYFQPDDASIIPLELYFPRGSIDCAQDAVATLFAIISSISVVPEDVHEAGINREPSDKGYIYRVSTAHPSIVPLLYAEIKAEAEEGN